MHMLKLYLPQTAKHGGRLLHEWVLEEAQRIGIPGGSVFRAVAGYGRHGRLHEEHFFELAGDLPMMVEFVGEAGMLDTLLQRLAGERLSVFYIRLPVESGQT